MLENKRSIFKASVTRTFTTSSSCTSTLCLKKHVTTFFDDKLN